MTKPAVANEQRLARTNDLVCVPTPFVTAGLSPYLMMATLKNIKKTRITVNTKINKFDDFYEILLYRETFDICFGTQSKKELSPRDENTFYKNEKSYFDSTHRTKDKFYSFGLCNTWNYFCTFTVSVKEFESTDEATKYYWQVFRQKLQRKFPSIKILAVPEYHKKGNLHFHALLGSCDLSQLLTAAIKRKGKQIYNLSLWNKGFSTVVKIDTFDTETQQKTVSYLIKYLTKAGYIGYNKKKYYHTVNLNQKNVDYRYINPSSFNNVKPYKTTDKMTVYRWPK